MPHREPTGHQNWSSHMGRQPRHARHAVYYSADAFLAMVTIDKLPDVSGPRRQSPYMFSTMNPVLASDRDISSALRNRRVDGATISSSLLTNRLHPSMRTRFPSTAATSSHVSTGPRASPAADACSPWSTSPTHELRDCGCQTPSAPRGAARRGANAERLPTLRRPKTPAPRCPSSVPGPRRRPRCRTLNPESTAPSLHPGRCAPPPAWPPMDRRR